MSRSRSGRWARRAVWGTLAVVAAAGCNPLATLAFLTHKDTPKPAKYPLFPKDEKGKEKEEVAVVVFVHPATGSGQDYVFAGAEGVIASELSKRMPEMAKEVKKKVAVVPPKEVNRYKMRNPQWALTPAPTRGKELRADYVLDVTLKNMTLFQPGSLKQLYEGRAEVVVEFWDVREGGEPEHYIHPFAYPKDTVLDATSIPVGTFKKAFLERLAVEVAQYHIDYKPDSGIAEGR